MSHGQLVHVGIRPDQIKRWVRRGMLLRLYSRVYAVGHIALSPLARLQAALLACGPGAVLSHASAAFLWGWLDHPPGPIELTMAGQRRPKPGIRMHRSSSIDGRDIRVRHGLPVTSPARTIIDQAAHVTPDELERLIAEARVRRLLRPGELEAAAQQAGRRQGAARTRAFLAAEGEPGITRSKGERILRRLLGQARLSQPRTNARLAGYEVDFLWEEQRLVVEFDGWQFHGDRRAFERDRRKDVALASAGYQVLRFTWRQLTEEPLAVIAAIAHALGRRSPAAH